MFSKKKRLTKLHLAFFFFTFTQIISLYFY
uniref:Uncharacterized protein n=1 Tax=Phyllymenia taiwanensis TaxID=1260292 RepID=R9XYE2_9FLOR|nr:hypothetical protein [Grateloupia taiwanensis]AGO19800.1 hypothetical protein [Grateloupia taiwanensis]